MAIRLHMISATETPGYRHNDTSGVNRCAYAGLSNDGLKQGVSADFMY